MGSKGVADALAGPFPAWGAAAGSFQQLGYLDMSANSLTGALPASLSQCASTACTVRFEDLSMHPCCSVHRVHVVALAEAEALVSMGPQVN